MIETSLLHLFSILIQVDVAILKDKEGDKHLYTLKKLLPISNHIHFICSKTFAVNNKAKWLPFKNIQCLIHRKTL